MTNIFKDKQMQSEVRLVKQLGERIGYGNMMELVSALWRKSLKDSGAPTTGAFIATCEPFVDKEILEATKAERELYDGLIKHNL